MKYFKIKCEKCGNIKKLIFDGSLVSDDVQRDMKISSIFGESWIGTLPPLTDFCYGDCSRPSNFIGGRGCQTLKLTHE
jgi:hypothetical protein